MDAQYGQAGHQLGDLVHHPKRDPIAVQSMLSDIDCGRLVDKRMVVVVLHQSKHVSADDGQIEGLASIVWNNGELRSLT